MNNDRGTVEPEARVLEAGSGDDGGIFAAHVALMMVDSPEAAYDPGLARDAIRQHEKTWGPSTPQLFTDLSWNGRARDSVEFILDAADYYGPDALFVVVVKTPPAGRTRKG